MNALKFAFRQLLKNPGFTAVAVLTRGIGGACRLPARPARTQPIREYGDNSPMFVSGGKALLAAWTNGLRFQVRRLLSDSMVFFHIKNGRLWAAMMGRIFQL